MKIIMILKISIQLQLATKNENSYIQTNEKLQIITENQLVSFNFYFLRCPILSTLQIFLQFDERLMRFILFTEEECFEIVIGHWKCHLRNLNHILCHFYDIFEWSNLLLNKATFEASKLLKKTRTQKGLKTNFQTL